MSAAEEREPVAIRHSFDGYGWRYIDNGSGSDWFKRGMAYPDAEPVYGAAIQRGEHREEG